MSRAGLTRLALSLVLAALAAVAMPAPPARAGTPWTLVMQDDFSSDLNTNRWGAYTGHPGGNPYGYWSPRHLATYRGTGLLRGFRENGRFVTAGMMLNSYRQTYGKYTVRARFGRGSGIEHTMLLWPAGGTWPPELDFSEGTSAYTTMATAHWSSANLQKHILTSVMMCYWHTYSVEWTPTSVRFLLDGRVFGSVTGDAVPKVAMNLALQTYAIRPIGAISLTQPRSVDLAIDWVRVYRYTP